MALTDTTIRNAKPRAKPYKLADGGGLFLLVNPNGSRLWRQKFRVNGREQLISHGSYPAVSLAQAREKREEARRLLGNGINPSAERKAAREQIDEAGRNTFAAVAAEFLAKCEREGRAGATMDKKRWLLGMAVPISVIGRSARSRQRRCCGSSGTLEARGTYETALRLRSTLGAVFRYAVATGRAENDPTFPLRGALTVPKVVHRAAFTDEKCG
jgi:hypothetical protein